MIDVLICNHNTRYYTNNCIRTFIHENRNFEYKISILDDSDREKFSLDQDYSHDNIVILDNTKQKIFSYDEIINKYVEYQRYGNACYHHSMNIQWFIDNISSKNLLLLDSDIIFKRNIDFIDKRYITVGFLQKEFFIQYRGSNILRHTRIYPFLQYFNTDIIKKNNIKYFDPKRLIQDKEDCLGYDTGASFYEDIVKSKVQFKILNNINEYIHHYGSRSWYTKN